jgi:hypothetical protein
MNTDLCKRIVREVFTEPGRKWFLLKNGTVMVFKDIPEADDDYVIAAWRKLADALGPYEGQGSSLGDCGVQKLRNYGGWLVDFSFPCVTYVGAEEIDFSPARTISEMYSDPTPSGALYVLEAQVAMIGRHKRNLDARDPQIIARSTDKETE